MILPPPPPHFFGKLFSQLDAPRWTHPSLARQYARRGAAGGTVAMVPLGWIRTGKRTGEIDHDEPPNKKRPCEDAAPHDLFDSTPAVIGRQLHESYQVDQKMQIGITMPRPTSRNAR
jgi:hypothetical protein